MSRGPGRTQRQALEVLEREARSMDAVEVACSALGRTITGSEASSYRRALRSLARRGIVADLGRSYRFGRRHYATLDVAAEMQERYRATFGEPWSVARPLP